LNPRVRSKVSWIDPTLRTHDLCDVTHDVIHQDCSKCVFCYFAIV